MERSPFKIPFTSERVPHWGCPACQSGQLTLLPDSLVKEETADSRDHSHEAWEPDWIRYVYSCIFVCSNTHCREVVTSSGTGRVDFHEYLDEEEGWSQSADDLFTPKFFHPALRLLDIPLDCPIDVGAHLYESFSLYFADAGASLNAVRSAVEALLTSLGVKRFAVVKGVRRPISLHQRIALLPSKLSHLGEMLTAIKWLGNAGSHSTSAVSQDDVLLAYDLVEHVLREIYDGKAKTLANVAKKVNKKKGPIKVKEK